jgi:type VI secretion system protein ImpH
MATEKRADRNRLEIHERLVVDGIPRTRFFTAIRLLERLTAGRPRIGGETAYGDEAIRFRHTSSLGSQPNELERIEYVEVARGAERRLEKARHKYEVTTCFLGLSGADSPLALYHADDLVRDDEWGRRQNDFLDMFHNRLTALFYRCVGKYDVPGEFLSDGSDPSSLRLLAMAGVDMYGLREFAGVSRLEFLRVSALMALGASTARSMENALKVLLRRELDGVGLSVEQFTGGWVTFDPSQWSSLGRANTEAGSTFMIGTRVRHPAHRSAIEIGPMDPDHARTFSPGGASYTRLRGLIGAFSTTATDFELALLIREGAHRPFVLGKRNLGKDVYITAKRGDDRIAKHVYELNSGDIVRRRGDHGKAKSQ